MWSPLRLFAWVSVAVLPALLPTASVQGAELEALVAVVPSIKSIESVNPGELQVEWAWIVKKKPENDWKVFFHLRKSGVESDQGISAGDYMPNLPTSSWPRGKTVTEFSRASIPADLPGKFDDQIAEGLVGPGVGFVAEPETFLVKLNPFAGDAPEDHRAQTSVSDG